MNIYYIKRQFRVLIMYLHIYWIKQTPGNTKKRSKLLLVVT